MWLTVISILCQDTSLGPGIPPGHVCQENVGTRGPQESPNPSPKGAPQASSPPRQAATVPSSPPHITSTVPTWGGEEDIHYVKAESRKPGERPPGPAAPLPAELGELRTRPQTHTPTHVHSSCAQDRGGKKYPQRATHGRAAPTLGGGSARRRSTAPTHPQPRTPKTRRSVKQARAQGPR